MLMYALGLLMLALIAGVLGFGAVAGAAVWAAQLLFAGFLVVFVMTLVAGRRPPAP